jgi:hypothetical protein
MTIKEQDYEGYKHYVCTLCRPQWDTFDKAEAEEHDKAGVHRGTKAAAK